MICLEVALCLSNGVIRSSKKTIVDVGNLLDDDSVDDYSDYAIMTPGKRDSNVPI